MLFSLLAVFAYLIFSKKTLDPSISLKCPQVGSVKKYIFSQANSLNSPLDAYYFAQSNPKGDYGPVVSAFVKADSKESAIAGAMKMLANITEPCTTAAVRSNMSYPDKSPCGGESYECTYKPYPCEQRTLKSRSIYLSYSFYQACPESDINPSAKARTNSN